MNSLIIRAGTDPRIICRPLAYGQGHDASDDDARRILTWIHYCIPMRTLARVERRIKEAEHRSLAVAAQTAAEETREKGELP